jgi:hypothetical protein
MGAAGAAPCARQKRRRKGHFRFKRAAEKFCERRRTGGNDSAGSAFCGAIKGRRPDNLEAIMTHTLFACLVAGALVIPQAVIAGDAPAPQEATLALPPIPYIETIPWLAAGKPKKTIDARLYHGFGVARFTAAVTPPVVRHSALSLAGITPEQSGAPTD